MLKNNLQINAKSVELLQHEVDVLLGAGLVGDDGPEEVWFVVQRLVTDHQVASVHHPRLELGRDLPQLLHPLLVVVQVPEPLRDVPEANIHHLRIVLDKVEPVAVLPHLLELVLCELHDSVHLQLEAV